MCLRKIFSVADALHCAKGEHNHIRDTVARLLDEKCHDVQIEPHLQPL